MADKIGEVTIKVYEDNSAFILDSPRDPGLQITMFAFYFDKVLHNLSKNISFGLIDMLLEKNNKFFEKKNISIEKRLEKAYFGSHILDKEIDKKILFEAKREYYKKNDQEFYLQTKFKPIFIKNDLMEHYAANSVAYFYDYILSFCSERGAVFLMTVLNHMLSDYQNNKKLPPIGEVPSATIYRLADAFMKEFEKIDKNKND